MSNSSNSDASSITDAQLHFSTVLEQYCAVPGVCVCFLVLVAYGVAACFPKARKRMDRVSFRLVIYALIFNVLFGIAYAAAPSSPGAACTIEVFCVNLFLCFSTFFTTCIAINLQLVVVHHVDGRRMEKYYLIGTTLLSLVLNVPTLALDQFGWDAASSVCWYKNPNPILQLHWLIATQSFWIALAATIETICSCVVLVKMFLWQKNSQAFFITSSIARLQSNARGATNATDTTRVSRYRRSIHDPRYRSVILRIALYPIVSLILNYSTVALDLNNTIQGLHTQLDFRLLVLDFFLYGLRTLVYGLLAAVDPSFIAVLRDIRNQSRTSANLTSDIAMNSVKSLAHSQGTTIAGDETQSRLKLELTSSERERISKADTEQRLGVQTTGQDLESSVQYDDELDFPIEKQL